MHTDSSPCCKATAELRVGPVCVALGHCAEQVHPGVSVLLRWTTYQNRQGLTRGFALLANDLALAERCEVRVRQLCSQTGFSIFGFPRDLFS